MNIRKIVRVVVIFLAVGIIGAAFAIGLTSNSKPLRASSTPAQDLIAQAEQHFRATTISYPKWLSNVQHGVYSPADGSGTEWGMGFAALEAAKQAENNTTTTSSTTASTVSTNPSGPDVTSFTLINADTDTDIGPFTDGETLDLATLPTRNLNVRANATGQTLSVRFGLDTVANFRTESTAPFTLAGDAAGDYYPWTPTTGAHTLVATAYDGTGATGTAGPSKTIRFTVTDTPSPSGSVVFRGDFESCNLDDGHWFVADTFHGYTSSSTYARGSDYIDRNNPGSGNCALRQDLPAATTPGRADVGSQPFYSISLGQDIYYTDEFRLPSNWQIPTGWGYAVGQYVAQQPNIWASPAQTVIYGPQSGQGFNYGGLTLTLQSGKCANPTGCSTSNKYVVIPPQNLTTGVWHQYIIHVHIAQDASGVLEAWWRNRGETTWNKSASVTGVPTVQWSNTTPNPLLGKVLDYAEGYRGVSNFPISIWHDSFCRATSFAAAVSCF